MIWDEASLMKSNRSTLKKKNLSPGSGLPNLRMIGQFSLIGGMKTCLRKHLNSPRTDPLGMRRIVEFGILAQSVYPIP